MKYSEYPPTSFDPRGSFLPERQDWLVAPVGKNRNSDVLDEFNFEALIKALGGESETVEVHRFGHWAYGWCEVVLVHPSREAELDELEGALSDYSVLDESDYSERI